MSKKRIFPQDYGERKKSKLNITILDSNYPSSQNENCNPSNGGDTWGDDNDDEILLLASQACEQAYINNDITSLPNYTICMQPPASSTQICDQPDQPVPSTSKTNIVFNKLSTNLSNPSGVIPKPHLSLKRTFDQNSRLLPNIPHMQTNNADNLTCKEKIYECQDSNYIYRQLLQLQEENTKLKSDVGALFEKCQTKEGEVSILRTQLKSCQTTVDHARLESVRAQQKVQMDWREKLTAANNQMQDLQTQLELKNLEIIKVKEKFKMLESSKVNLTQVNVANMTSSSQRHNNSMTTLNNSLMLQGRKANTVSNSVQTEKMSHFLRLKRTCRTEPSKLRQILPLILETNTTQPHSILNYNNDPQTPKNYSQRNCMIISIFQQLHTTPIPVKGKKVKSNVSLNDIYECLACIANENGRLEEIQEKYFKIFNTIKGVLNETCSQLEKVSQKTSISFQKEMDNKYIEATSTFVDVKENELLSGKALFQQEQAILARRMTALLAIILEPSESVETLRNFENKCKQNPHSSTSRNNEEFIEIIRRTCNLLDGSSCALLYSGLHLSIIVLLKSLVKHVSEMSLNQTMIIEIIKSSISTHSMSFVICPLWDMLQRLALIEGFLTNLCPKVNTGNLKKDYLQGVLLYEKDSCSLLVLLKQTEVLLKCIEKQNLTCKAIDTARSLIAFYRNTNNDNTSMIQDNAKCACQSFLLQVLVYAIKICAVMLSNTDTIQKDRSNTYSQLLAICRSGVQIFYQCCMRDVDFGLQLTHYEGYLIEVCEIMKIYENEVYGNMLSELMVTFQAPSEKALQAYHSEAWMESFKSFSLTE